MKIPALLTPRSATVFACRFVVISVAVLSLILIIGRVIRRPRVAAVHPPVTTPAGAADGGTTAPAPRASGYGRHGFRRPNSVITDYDDDVVERLRTLVDRKATSDDLELIRLIEDLLDPPSGHMVKISGQLVSTPQSREVDKILQQKRGGFYVECGAFDGERSSNTLYLERERGWTGLLVEMDPYFYTQLIGKSRRSWSINACLSPQPYVTQVAFKESMGQIGQLLDSGSGQTKVNRKEKNSMVVPCFPLQALLVALNRTTVDYFSLDIEGFELGVLRTIPFHKIDVSVLSVEYVHGRSGKQSYVKFMKQQGYRVHKDIHFLDKSMAMSVDDFIFVKTRS